MPIYLVPVTETRTYNTQYWVEASSASAAFQQVEFGETIAEGPATLDEVVDREANGTPKKVRLIDRKRGYPRVHTLAPRELHTVLAALRAWQARLASPLVAERQSSRGGPRQPTMEDLNDLASNGKTVLPLDLVEIDSLCQRLNCES